MREERLAPNTVGDELGAAGSPVVAPSVLARLRARVFSYRYDCALEAGVDPEPGSALQVHGARLSSEAERADLADRMKTTELAFCFGFPYADFIDCGAAIAVFAETQASADAAADAFLAAVNARESTFVQDTLPSAQAVAEALRIAIAAYGQTVGETIALVAAGELQDPS